MFCKHGRCYRQIAVVLGSSRFEWSIWESLTGYAISGRVMFRMKYDSMSEKANSAFDYSRRCVVLFFVFDDWMIFSWRLPGNRKCGVGSRLNRSTILLARLKMSPLETSCCLLWKRGRVGAGRRNVGCKVATTTKWNGRRWVEWFQEQFRWQMRLLRFLW